MGRRKKNPKRNVKISSDEKGKYSEYIVELTLKELKKECLIKDYIKHDQYEMGKDYSIVFLDDSVFPLQVKSSYVGVYEHQMNYWKENIPAVVINQYGISKKNRKHKEPKLIKKAKKDIIKIYRIK